MNAVTVTNHQSWDELAQLLAPSALDRHRETSRVLQLQNTRLLG